MRLILLRTRSEVILKRVSANRPHPGTKSDGTVTSSESKRSRVPASNVLPLAPPDPTMRRPRFLSPYPELGVCVVMPGIGQVKGLTGGDPMIFGFHVAAVFPLDTKRRYAILGRMLSGPGYYSFAAMFRMRFKLGIGNREAFVSVGASSNDYRRSGSIIVSLRGNSLFAQVGVEVIKEWLELVGEFPVVGSTMTTSFEGRTYKADPAGPVITLTLCL